MAKGNSRVMSMININEQKAGKFYSEVISLYPPEVIKMLWRSKTEFLDSLEGAVYKGDNKEYEVDFSRLKIRFSKPIFNILFLNKTVSKFDKPIGQRLELNNYIYLELKESPLVNLEDKESAGLFPLSKKKYYGGYFFINENSRDDSYYPKEVLSLFIFQLEKRLIKYYDFNTNSDIYINFCSLFEPIKYILKIKKDKETLKEKALYRLCTDFGLIEHKRYTTTKINISQNINEIYDKDTNSFLLTARKQYNIDSLKFYLSAMENLDPSYQFLELYHVLESYFYKYFYDYIKNLKKVKTQKEFNRIREYIREEGMLKLVIKGISNKFSQLKQEISNISNVEQFCENFLPKKRYLDNLDENNEEKFSNKLSDFVYQIRNNIVHTKESSKKSIRNSSEGEQRTLMEINKLLLSVVRKVFDENIEW